MNFLRRAIAAERFLSSHSSRKRLLSIYPASLLQYTSFSTATSRTSTTTRYKRATPKTQAAEQSPSPPSVASVDWPRPSEIPWQAKVANSVNLIGRVKIPVWSKASEDGKFWAGTIITQEDHSSSTYSPPLWIPVVFEGDLAHIAAYHLKEKDCVYIAGQLSMDLSQSLSQGQANVQVMVHSINFVQGFPQLKKSFVPRKQEELVINRSAAEAKDPPVVQIDEEDGALASDFKHGKPASMRKEENPTLSSWRDLLKNPKQWSDNRAKKHNRLVKANYPDFKHKDGGSALWLSTAPGWILAGLAGLEFDVKDEKGDEHWKDLVENPNKWWDNRSNKRNERGPDFKHKDTGEVLWLNHSPAWALDSLPPLKANQNDAISKRKWSTGVLEAE